ncbi:hypothetical protein ACHAXN_011115 [Cyclotella atomus]
MITDDKKLPQNETQFTALSRFVLPTPGTKQGHNKELAIARAIDGIPSTISCAIDKAFAIQTDATGRTLF